MTGIPTSSRMMLGDTPSASSRRAPDRCRPRCWRSPHPRYHPPAVCEPPPCHPRSTPARPVRRRHPPSCHTHLATTGTRPDRPRDAGQASRADWTGAPRIRRVSPIRSVSACLRRLKGFVDGRHPGIAVSRPERSAIRRLQVRPIDLLWPHAPRRGLVARHEAPARRHGLRRCAAR